jgi:hypothetical protein
MARRKAGDGGGWGPGSMPAWMREKDRGGGAGMVVGRSAPAHGQRAWVGGAASSRGGRGR